MNESKPLVCSQCGQAGDQRPGFRRRDSALEAVGTLDDGMLAVESFECCACGYAFIVPLGSIEVRKP